MSFLKRSDAGLLSVLFCYSLLCGKKGIDQRLSTSLRAEFLYSYLAAWQAFSAEMLLL